MDGTAGATTVDLMPFTKAKIKVPLNDSMDARHMYRQLEIMC